jgi:hypothetical protein
LLRYRWADRSDAGSANEKINESSRTRDDIVEIRLYIDSDYRGYGVEYLKFVDANSPPTVVKFRLSTTESISSGLTNLPVDIPFVLPGSSVATTMPLAEISEEYVASRLVRMGVRSGCDRAGQWSYQDVFGSQVQTSWCVGHPLPSRISTKRFLAVQRR